MKQVSKLDVRHTWNAGVLAYLQSPWNKHPHPKDSPPDEVVDPYRQLGTHPELVAWLWDTMTAKLPEACQHIVYGKPALVHPRTGIIFGFGHGEQVCALRLAMDKIGESIMAGMEDDVELDEQHTLYGEDIGDDWVFCTWTEDDPDWCLRAYENAAHPSGS